MNHTFPLAQAGIGRNWSPPQPALARIQRAADEVRCQCVVCGSHVYASPGVSRGGKCGNCGSYELQPLQ
jgi:hypothetical protein